MLTVKTITFKEATTNYSKTYFVNGSTDDTLIKAFGDNVVAQYANGAKPLTVVYGTQNIYSGADMTTLKAYAADEISHEFKEES